MLGLTGQPAYQKHTKSKIQRETLAQGDEVKRDRGDNWCLVLTFAYTSKGTGVGHLYRHPIINQKEKGGRRRKRRRRKGGGGRREKGGKDVIIP